MINHCKITFIDSDGKPNSLEVDPETVKAKLPSELIACCAAAEEIFRNAGFITSNVHYHIAIEE